MSWISLQLDRGILSIFFFVALPTWSEVDWPYEHIVHSAKTLFYMKKHFSVWIFKLAKSSLNTGDLNMLHYALYNMLYVHLKQNIGSNIRACFGHKRRFQLHHEAFFVILSQPISLIYSQLSIQSSDLTLTGRFEVVTWDINCFNLSFKFRQSILRKTRLFTDNQLAQINSPLDVKTLLLWSTKLHNGFVYFLCGILIACLFLRQATEPVDAQPNLRGAKSLHLFPACDIIVYAPKAEGCLCCLVPGWRA